MLSKPILCLAIAVIFTLAGNAKEIKAIKKRRKLIFLQVVIKNSQAVKKGAAPKKAMVKKDVKSKVAAKKWL